MQIDVAGRVRNTPLAANKGLLPLCEAIVNSFEAIEDAGVNNGRIDVTIVRDSSSLFREDESGVGEIEGFRIEDNGVGFDEEHFGAFQTSDTRYKASRGGRGNARFLWLVAFEKAIVDSCFETNAGSRRREFEFISEGSGIKDEKTQSVTGLPRRTCVKLVGFREKYRNQCPKKASTVAARIVEHCLEYVIRSACPIVSLHDESLDEHIDLNAQFAEIMLSSSARADFKVGEYDFQIMHFRLRSTHHVEHLVHYCADRRVVLSRKILGKIENLAKHMSDDSGESFVYAGYVSSELLNKSVNAERTGFALPDNASELLVCDITWQDIREATLEQCRAYLEPLTEAISQLKSERIQRFVETQAPEYRPILRHIEDDLAAIDPEIEDEALDLKLYEAYHALQVRLRAHGQELLEHPPVADEDIEEFEERMSAYVELVTDINSSDLARYVCHRKTILDFMNHLLKQRDDSKYQYEDRIHSIIFPMGATSDEVQPDSHNLWLVDEKLVYHRFLASDKQLRTVEPIETTSRKEPDLLVFDAACAFVASDEPPFSSVTIVELKRPMRNDYTEEENPFVQVRKYITDIRGGRARTREGRDIPVGEDVPIYCYIVCDPTPSLDTWAKDFELQRYPDRQGYFGFKKHYNAFVEVISYTRLLTDAKKRNAVFFRKLGLPNVLTDSGTREVVDS